MNNSFANQSCFAPCEEKSGLEHADTNDVNELVLLENTVFGELDSRLSKRAFFHHIHHKNNLFLITREKTRQISSYILILVHQKNARIYSVATHPDFLGKGLATALIRKSVAILKERNKKNLYLEVRTTNQRAMDLYLRLGFVKRSIKKNFYMDDGDALVMNLALD